MTYIAALVGMDFGVRRVMGERLGNENREENI
jgi:hypothetical protein